MKNLITIFVMLVAVGCSKSLTEGEKKVVGSYEGRLHPSLPPIKYVFLKNRTSEFLNQNGVKDTKKYKWKLVGEEIHRLVPSGESVYKINPNGDLVWIATIDKGGK